MWPLVRCTVCFTGVNHLSTFFSATCAAGRGSAICHNPSSAPSTWVQCCASFRAPPWTRTAGTRLLFALHFCGASQLRPLFNGPFMLRVSAPTCAEIVTGIMVQHDNWAAPLHANSAAEAVRRLHEHLLCDALCLSPQLRLQAAAAFRQPGSVSRRPTPMCS